MLGPVITEIIFSFVSKTTSLGTNKGLFDKKIRSVELMGTEQSVDWKQNADGLEIVYPDSVDLKTAVGFRIVCE